jgi:O-antigen/teichoic acid export membrane protein
LKYLFSFGIRILLTEVIDAIFKNIYSVIIGRYYSRVDLGYYTRANSLCLIPQNLCSKTVVQTSIPVFSKLQDDNRALQGAALKYTKFLLFLILPIMLGVYVLAEPFVEIFLTSKWMPSVPFIKILCFVSIIAPLSVLYIGIMKAKRRADLFLYLEIFRKSLLVLIVLLTYRWGVMMIMFGIVAQNILAYFVSCYFIKRLIDLKLSSFHIKLLPYVLNAFLMFFLLIIIKPYISGNWVQLICLPPLGGVIYLAGAWLLKLDILKDIHSLMQKVPIIGPYFTKIKII